MGSWWRWTSLISYIMLLLSISSWALWWHLTLYLLLIWGWKIWLLFGDLFGLNSFWRLTWAIRLGFISRLYSNCSFTLKIIFNLMCRINLLLTLWNIWIRFISTNTSLTVTLLWMWTTTSTSNTIRITYSELVLLLLVHHVRISITLY